MRLAWAIIDGAVLGLALSDVLNATGLHWLSWVIAGLLFLFAVAGTVLFRRRP